MDVARIQVIYDEIAKYEIKLEADPRSLGPRYLQDVIAKGRNYLNAVSRLQLEVHREKQEISRNLRAAEVEFQIAFDYTLANDERTRRLPSIEDRKSHINVILGEQLRGIATIKARIHDLEFVDKAVRHRHRELTSTMSDIKLQRSLIRDEIDSGAMYGDERLTEQERNTAPGRGPLGDDIDEAELDKLFDEGATTPAPVVEAVIPAPVAEVAPPAPGPSSPRSLSPDEEAVQAFLGNPRDFTVSEDFSDIFEKF